MKTLFIYMTAKMMDFARRRWLLMVFDLNANIRQAVRKETIRTTK